MKKIEKSFVAIFTLLALNCLTLNAKAQSATDSDTDKGVYLQGGVASLKYTYGTYSYNLGTTYAVYAGYNFNKNIIFITCISNPYTFHSIFIVPIIFYPTIWIFIQ